MNRVFLVFLIGLALLSGCGNPVAAGLAEPSRLIYPNPPARLFVFQDKQIQGSMFYHRKARQFTLELKTPEQTLSFTYPPSFDFVPLLDPQLLYRSKSRDFLYQYRVANQRGPENIAKFLFGGLAPFNNPSPVSGWRFKSALPTRPTSGWMLQNFRTPGLKPGESRVFSFESKAPPGVVEFQLWGQAKNPDIPVNSPKITAGVDEVIYSLARLNGVRIYLPAPVSVPRMKTSRFPLYVLGHLKIAREMGWLTQGSCRDWEKSLKKLSSLLDAGSGAEEQLLKLHELIKTQLRQETINREAGILLRGNLEFLADRLNDPVVYIPYTPSDAETCLASMREARTAVGFYLKETGKWPEKYQDLVDLLPAFGPMPPCPLGGETYGYQYCQNPPAFTVYCLNRHQDLPAGYPQYNYRGFPPDPYGDKIRRENR